MTESLVMTRNVYGSNSLETAMGRLHIGIAYKALYEDTTLSEDCSSFCSFSSKAPEEAFSGFLTLSITFLKSLP